MDLTRAQAIVAAQNEGSCRQGLLFQVAHDSSNSGLVTLSRLSKAQNWEGVLLRDFDCS